jgi:ribosomal protein S18 acetylase RimI-like enzyme
LYLTVHNLWSDGFLVITEERKVVGFVAAVPTGQKVARVLMLAVMPENRRRSLGKILMGELYASCRAKGFDTVMLEVRKSNGAALAFYEREGFSIFGEIKSFYSNGEDAWKLTKNLQT